MAHHGEAGVGDNLRAIVKQHPELLCADVGSRLAPAMAALRSSGPRKNTSIKEYMPEAVFDVFPAFHGRRTIMHD